MQKLISLFITIVLFSCEYTREVEIDLPAPKAVLNGILFSDSLFRVNVSSTYNGIDDPFMLNPKAIFIEDAEVSFYLNDEFKGLLVPGENKGDYSMPGYFPRHGDRIALAVKTAKYPPLYAETKIPAKSQILQVDTMSYTISHEIWEEDFLRTDIRIKTDKSQKNYYLLAITNTYTYRDYENEEEYIQYNNYYLNINDPLFSRHPDTYQMRYIHALHLPGDESNVSGDYFIFSNESFPQEEQTLSLDLGSFSYGYGDTQEEYFILTHLKIHLLSISPSFFLYLRSKRLRYENEDIISKELQNPYPVFTNIQGGYGLLGATCEDVYELIIRKYR